MIKAFKYRLYPTPAQERELLHTLDLCRHLYNAALSQRRVAWEQRRTVTWYDQKREVTEIRAAMPEYRQIGSHVLQETLRRLDRAYQGFYARLRKGLPAGLPRFRSRRRFDSFTYPDLSNWRLAGGRLELRWIGAVKIRLHRPVAGVARTLTIRRQVDGWYAVVTARVEPQPLPPTGRAAGIDLGLLHLVTTSDGDTIPFPRHLRQAERRLKWHQRRVSRRRKGSGRWRQAVRELARAHQRVANRRRDAAHKAARVLVDRYDVIAVEDLRIANLVRNHHLAGSIHDAAWGALLQILASKAAAAGRQVVQVNPRGTSQECSSCGAPVPKALHVRRHDCPHCGLSLDRDRNAAINILRRAAG